MSVIIQDSINSNKQPTKNSSKFSRNVPPSSNIIAFTKDELTSIKLQYLI